MVEKMRGSQRFKWFYENNAHICEMFGLPPAAQISEIDRGERGDVLQLKCGGKYYAIKRQHSCITVEGMDFISAVTQELAQHVPEVPADLTCVNGDGYYIFEGRIITVTPWYSGQVPSKLDESYDLQMANLMGRLHKYAALCQTQSVRSDRPPFYMYNLERNVIFDIERVKDVLYHNNHFLYANRPPEEKPYIDAMIAARDFIMEQHDWLRDFMRRLTIDAPKLLHAPIHADIYYLNLLCERGSINKLIDWEDCKREILCYELGRVIWEVAKDRKNFCLNKRKADAFVEEYYKAGGNVPMSEHDRLIDYIRQIRVLDTLFYVNNSVTGDYWDAYYATENINSLRNL